MEEKKKRKGERKGMREEDGVHEIEWTGNRVLKTWVPRASFSPPQHCQHTEIESKRLELLVS